MKLKLGRWRKKLKLTSKMLEEKEQLVSDLEASRELQGQIKEQQEIRSNEQS